MWFAHRSDAAQNVVTHCVPVCIVCLLEVIEFDYQQRSRRYKLT
jgi:hypothetical protein